MRTKTGILWTILVIDFLLLLSESESTDPVSTTLATTKPPGADPAANTPTTTIPTTATTVPTEATTAKTVPTTTEVTIAKTVPTGQSTTQPTPIGPTTAKTAPTEQTTAKPTIAESTTAKPTTTEPTTTKPNATEPAAATTAKPTTIAPTSAKTTDAGPIAAHSTPASPTSAGPSSTPPATQSPSTEVPTDRNPASDQTSTSSHETPASTTVAAKPPASTQPGPDQTSQGPFISSEEPDLAILQTTKPVILEPFNETITLEFMQEPRNKENRGVQFCLMLLVKVGVNGSCILNGEKADDRYTVTSASVAVDQSVIKQISDSISALPPEPTSDSTPVPHTLIAILSSCGALVLILVIFALYCTYHHRSYRKNQQHLTEELQTVENGYHDNPTLEVMEVQPEMQEKKVALNGEFNDSWIVPFDNLAKEEIPDEEDTHL